LGTDIVFSPLQKIGGLTYVHVIVQEGFWLYTNFLNALTRLFLASGAGNHPDFICMQCPCLASDFRKIITVG